MIILAFALFGALMARSISTELEAIPVSALLAALGGWLAVGLLRWLLAAAAAGEGRAKAVLGQAVRSAMGLLLPFALLAAMAQLFLGWQATQAFFAAGMMSGAASAATACMRLGAPGLRVVVIASSWALIGAGAWVRIWMALAPWLEATP